MATKPKEAPASPSGASHYRFKVKAPINAFGTQFNPGVLYTVKAKVYDAVKAVAVDVQPVNKE